MTTPARETSSPPFTDDVWPFLLERAGIAAWDWNVPHEILTISSAGREMLGYTQDELIGAPATWFDQLHPDDRPGMLRLADEYRAGRTREHVREVRVARKDGHYRRIISRGRVMTSDARGYPARVVGIITDITSNENIAASMRNSEQRLLLAMDDAQMAWFSRDLATDIGIGSPSLATIYDLSSPTGPWHYSEIRARILPEDLHDHVATVAKSLEEIDGEARVFAMNYRIRRRDGEIRHLEVRYRHDWDLDRPRAFGLVVDVTRTKQAELALSETDARLQIALEHARMAWFERNIESGVTQCSRSMWTIYGYEPQDVPFTFQHVLARMHPEDRARHGALPHLLRNTEPDDDSAHVIRYRIVPPGGEWRWVEVRYHVSPRANDGQGSVYGVVLDITDIKTIENAVRDSQARLQLSLEAADTASWHWLIPEDQVFSADRLGALYGLPGPGPWPLALILARIDPDDRKSLETALARVLDRHSDSLIAEFRITTDDGRTRWLEARARAEYAADGAMNRMFGVSVDITERKHAEQERQRLQLQLQQSQKMEAIGLLTGGIAHDFNNILGSILGYSGLALQRYGASMPTKLADYIREVQAAGERACDLVSQMLSFSRGEPTETVPTALGELVHTAVRMLRPTLPSSIEIHLEIPAALPPVAGDPVQIQQALVNFCINARDALGGVGNLWITLRVCDLAGRECASCHASISGRFVSLAVRDDGPGIPESVRERAFDPFFTTKGAGRGTGMGLSVTHGIAHRHEGHILLDTRPGHGTCFELVLPIAADLPSRPSPAEHADVAPPEEHSHEHVLVVDDEPSIAAFVGELLELHGYRATVETDAGKAMRRLREEGDRFCLLVTDQTMPRVTGAELAAASLARTPRLPVVMMTGYSASFGPQQAEEMGIAAYLRKPVRSDDLIAAIRRALQSRGEPRRD